MICWYDIIAMIILVFTVISCYLYLVANKNRRKDDQEIIERFYKE
ncbi:hypothetical protein M2475_001693 [Breznakia sp. PF5-3]|nr:MULTISPECIES: hypothetical protein [unclassified Breznakia]MDF9825241.1 hypothetical protein [Breznakia sp. PM6-1]MDF9836117.1 hypothetical protein [Breznakia sp. PF5-3]MDF9838394.1 hypothetical protein [Breznakia sp. PFB2-8]MDF9860410.1 hypothetical protein [Breznakia sp. PH5-24]